MSQIKIKNFGPIKGGYQENDGWLDIEKVTVFIGNQGSGKSSVAKLISTMKWLEKVLVRDDYKIEEFTHNGRFRRIYCGYHRLEDYFFDINKHDIAEFGYRGDAYSLYYQNGQLKIAETHSSRPYELPQTMYVPAERNFISTIRDLKSLKLSSDALSEFLNESEISVLCRTIYCLKFPKGIYVYRKRNADLCLIPIDSSFDKL
jgi:AAA ATPase domain